MSNGSDTDQSGADSSLSTSITQGSRVDKTVYSSPDPQPARTSLRRCSILLLDVGENVFVVKPSRLLALHAHSAAREILGCGVGFVSASWHALCVHAGVWETKRVATDFLFGGRRRGPWVRRHRGLFLVPARGVTRERWWALFFFGEHAARCVRRVGFRFLCAGLAHVHNGFSARFFSRRLRLVRRVGLFSNAAHEGQNDVCTQWSFAVL